MKITTDIPSQAAAGFEIVDRNIISSIEIGQEALYPVPLLPARLIAPGQAGARQRASVAVDQFTRLVNPDPQQANVFISLGRGLWRIVGTFTYSSNFATTTRLGAGSLSIVNTIKGQNVMVFNTAAATGVIHGRFNFDLLCDDENYTLDFFLGAPLAGGNAHHMAVCCVASKYL